MKIKNTSTEKWFSYWDDGNWNLFPFFRKKRAKRLGRKKFIKDQLNQLSRED